MHLLSHRWFAFPSRSQQLITQLALPGLKAASVFICRRQNHQDIGCIDLMNRGYQIQNTPYQHWFIVLTKYSAHGSHKGARCSKTATACVLTALYSKVSHCCCQSIRVYSLFYKRCAATVIHANNNLAYLRKMHTRAICALLKCHAHDINTLYSIRSSYTYTG